MARHDYDPLRHLFLFTGRRLLSWDTYEYRARIYNAYLGRFMSEDPKLFDAGDYNLFRYCHNDPLDLTDPMGLADSVTIEFAPAPGTVLVAPAEDKLVHQLAAGGPAASLMLPDERGLVTTVTKDPQTRDIHVQQKITITTLIAKSEVEAGKKEELKTKEVKRVDLFRSGVPEAQAKADALARAGFKGNEASAKKKVEESTTRVMKDKAREGKSRWDLPGGGN